MDRTPGGGPETPAPAPDDPGQTADEAGPNRIGPNQIGLTAAPMRGIAFKLAAVFLFTVMAALVKAASDTVPPGQAVFFRAFFALPIIVGFLALRGQLRVGLRVNSIAGHFWRGIIGVTAMGCGFAALGLLPLPEVTALSYAAPLITVLLAALLLGERLRAFRLVTVCIGFAGVVIVMWPRLSVETLDQVALMGVAFALASAGLRALAMIHIRRLVATEHTSAVVFYFTLTATALSLLTAPFGWVWPDGQTAMLLIGAGFIGGVAQILLTTSYRFAQAAVLAPFDYASLLFAILLGAAFFDEIPTLAVLTGSALVAASGIVIILRERALGLNKGAPPRPANPPG